MAVQPLSPATHRRLGGPLPRQPANGPQAHPPALPQELSRPCMCRTVSCGIITCFHVLFPTGGQITHVLLTRPPLPPTRGWTFVRLACVRHAASVHPEPGSNSLKNCIITSKLVIIIISRLSGFVRRFVYTGFSTSSGLLSINFKRISGSFVCFKLSLFNLQGTMLFRYSLLRSSSFILSHLNWFVKNFFHFFFQTFV